MACVCMGHMKLYITCADMFVCDELICLSVAHGCMLWHIWIWNAVICVALRCLVVQWDVWWCVCVCVCRWRVATCMCRLWYPWMQQLWSLFVVCCPNCVMHCEWSILWRACGMLQCPFVCNMHSALFCIAAPICKLWYVRLQCACGVLQHPFVWSVMWYVQWRH